MPIYVCLHGYSLEQKPSIWGKPGGEDKRKKAAKRTIIIKGHTEKQRDKEKEKCETRNGKENDEWE